MFYKIKRKFSALPVSDQVVRIKQANA